MYFVLDIPVISGNSGVYGCVSHIGQIFTRYRLQLYQTPHYISMFHVWASSKPLLIQFLSLFYKKLWFHVVISIDIMNIFSSSSHGISFSWVFTIIFCPLLLCFHHCLFSISWVHNHYCDYNHIKGLWRSMYYVLTFPNIKTTIKNLTPNKRFHHKIATSSIALSIPNTSLVIKYLKHYVYEIKLHQLKIDKTMKLITIPCSMKIIRSWYTSQFT